MHVSVTLATNVEHDLPRPKRRWWQWRNRTRFIVTLVISMIVWCAVDVRQRGRVDPNNPTAHRTDFTVYTEAGAAFFDGRDPYAVTNPRGWGYLYPPLFAMLVAPLHALDMRDQVVVWFAISALLAWGCYRQSVQILRLLMPDTPERGSFGPLPSWIGWSAVMAAMLPALNCLQRGQVGILKLYLLLAGFHLLVAGVTSATRKGWYCSLAGGLFALTIVLKVTPIISVGYTLAAELLGGLRARRRLEISSPGASCTAGVGIGLFACLLLLPAMLVGWRANLHHLETWGQGVAKNAERSTEGELAGDSYSIRNQSLSHAVCRFGNWAHYEFAGGPLDSGGKPDALGKRGLIMEAGIVAGVLRVVCLVEGLLLLVAVWRVAAPGLLNLAALFGMACVSTLVVAPIARGHYYLLFLPAVIFVTPWLLEHRQRSLALCMALTPALLISAHYLQIGVFGRVGLLGIGTAIWFTVGAVAMIRLGPLVKQRESDAMIDRPAAISRPHVAMNGQLAPTVPGR